MTPTGKHLHISIGSDMLWVLVVLAGFLFITSLVPLPPNDYWWHLRVGEGVFTERVIPTTNLYSWTVASDQPFIYAAWLGEFLLYLLHLAGGLELTIFTRTILVGVAFWLVGVEARRSSGSWRIAALATALACLMSINNLIIRTQIWAWLPFMLLYTCLSRYTARQASWKLLLLCPVVMIFWVNLHGSFVLGLGMMAIYIVGEAVRYIFKLNGSLSKKQLGGLAGSTVATLLAVLVNPRFTGIVLYLKNLLANQPVQQFIEEWQSPAPHGLANLVFFGSILLLIIALSISHARLTPSEILLTLAFLWLAWGSQRSVGWYGMVVMPVLGKLVIKIPIRLPTLPVQRNFLNLIIAILLFVPAILVQPWFVDQFPLPATYRAQIQNDPEIGPLLSTHTPIGAARYLKDHPGGRLFNELGYGSYLIWAAPEQLVFIDPRIELYTQEIWEDYICISNGVNIPFQLHEYAIDRVLLDKDLQPQLSIYLHNEPTWQLEYSDQFSELWRSIINPGVR
jgi:hypothetical protein